MRPIPEILVSFLKSKEALILRVYDDAQPRVILNPGSKIIGTLTYGYGHTEPSLTFPRDISQDMADNGLARDIQIAANRLAKVISLEAMQALTNNQFAALVSFVFNLGARPEWTIWKRVNAKAFDQVPLEMMKFVNAGGKKVQGLVNRRSAEVALWSTDEPGSVPDELPSSVTRNIDTPPTSSDPVPMSKSKMLISAIGSAVVAAPVAINQVSQAITPYADQSPYAAHALAILASAGAVAATLAVGFVWLHKKNGAN